MSTGFRFRAYPVAPVASVLVRWIGCQRFIKNAKVREDRYYRAFARRFVAFAGQHAPVDQAYSHLIGDGAGCADANTTWLRQVPSQVLRNGAALFFTGYQRFFKGLAKRPTLKSRHGEQSVWLTAELFRFEDVVDQDGVVLSRRLLIGTPKFPCGELAFTVNKGSVGPDGKRSLVDWQVPSSIHVSVNAGRWHVSFSNETAADATPPTEQQTLDQLRTLGESSLLQHTVGLDRGVAIPLMAAGVQGACKPFDILPVQQLRLAKKQKARARWQRRAARRVKGSANRRKANRQAARAGLYAADVRRNFAHQTSRTLVDSDNLLFVFEALKVQNMSASAAGTAAAPGKNVRQKAGLNCSILESAWGTLKLFTKYKAQAVGKLAIEVPPHYSSQECSACGHIHADNRVAQDSFVCQRCEHTENADTNAARVIARRGIRAVISGRYTLKEKKKVGSLRGRASTPLQDPQTLGPERSEATPVETLVSRPALTRRTHLSRKQECSEATQDTPTYNALGV